MYKVSIKIFENLKKQLEANNKFLAKGIIESSAREKVEITKLIKANEKQIILIKEEFYID